MSASESESDTDIENDCNAATETGAPALGPSRLTSGPSYVLHTKNEQTPGPRIPFGSSKRKHEEFVDR